MPTEEAYHETIFSGFNEKDCSVKRNFAYLISDDGMKKINVVSAQASPLAIAGQFSIVLLCPYNS